MQRDANVSGEAQEDPWVHVTTRHGLPADEVISALQKEIRRGREENAALLAYEMATTSPDLETMLWQRLKVISVEDVGWGDLRAAPLVDALDRLHQGFEFGSTDRLLFAVHAVRVLARSPKDRSSDEMTQWLARAVEDGEAGPQIPDYAVDRHTQRGRRLGRGYKHFYEEAARVLPEAPDRDLSYRDRLLALLRKAGQWDD
jgi:replication-associated recombination protein RarA